MNDLVPKPKLGLTIAIATSTVGVAVADYFTPLGIAVWILYLIPLILSLYVWEQRVPFIVAGAATVFIAVMYVTDTVGISGNVAIVNRALGIATILTVAFACNQSIRNKLAVRRHEWLQSAQNHLNEIMAGEQHLTHVGEKVLRYLAERLGAHAGAFYIEDSGAYRRFATYATEGRVLPEIVEPGDGLIGQAVRDARTFVVNGLPEGYLSIGSALGKVTPPSVLISPIEEEGVVNGVLELGFLYPVPMIATALMERVSESIAVAIRTSKYRTRLHELHEETQRQNEELQAQSEELRVNNEELEEQGRALKESHARLENQQAELEQTNVQLEEQAQRLEIQRDQLRVAKLDLETKTRELERASGYKSDFLANMSHELRTPLNSSLILAKLLADNRDGNLSPDQVKYAQSIHSAGNDLLTLINDILDLSKIEAGHMEVQPETIRIDRILEEMESVFRPLAMEKRIALQTERAEGAPEEMFTDPQRLQQILKNLMSNAVKFTESGSVSLTAGPSPAGGISFSVRDTGIGIPEEKQQAVFEAFQQADGTTSRKYGGTGLGLSITRQLVHLLEGEIRLESEPGKGSTFTVDLPLQIAGGIAPPIPIAQPAPAPIPLKATTQEPTPLPKGSIEDDRESIQAESRTLLVVEDDVRFASILYDLAHEFGFQCLVATSADEGLTLASQFNPSAAILDVNLPDHSGLSVLDRLKQDTRTRHIPVHVVSVSDYTQTALELGAVGYMLKPVKHEQLVQAFQQLEHRLTQKMRRVLIVEDDPMQLESMRLLLGTADVETVGVGTAAECLERLTTSTFDCMVLDLSLPDATGLSLLETLSREDRYSFPPVIVYTGRELSANEEQQLRKYSKSIIVKGAKSPERLLDEVTLFLHQVVSDLPAKHQKMLATLRDGDSMLAGRRILVVEDDVRNVFALTSVLEPKGAKVEIARNGKEALAALDAAPSMDLVLMDIMMPEMDGLTAMREIRKRPQWKKLPIIALTAKAMKNDQEECLAAGANDYMAKPLDVEQLLSLVRVWLPR